MPADPAVTRAAPLPLQVRDLTVRYGGVVAVEGSCLDVGPGQVVGLIGSEGSWNTFAIDAVTGFTRAALGRVRLGDRDATRLPVHRRAAAGLSRSFQSLELFEDMTVLDNLYAALRPARPVGVPHGPGPSRQPPAARPCAGRGEGVRSSGQPGPAGG